MRTFLSSFGFVASRFAGLIPQAEGSNPRFQIQGSLAEKGEGEMARVFPIVWRSSFSRRRGRVARGKPWGFALPFTQGGWQGQRLVQTWLQEPWLQADVLLLVGP